MTVTCADCDEYEQSINLRWDADQRAIKQWQAAHPGNDLVWPDHADMVVSLLDENDRLRAALRDIADNCDPDDPPWANAEDGRIQTGDIARKALNPST